MKFVKEREIIPPQAGWNEEAVYVVEVSFSATNPVHRAIFFSGYLHKISPSMRDVPVAVDRQGLYPGSYAQLWNPTWDHVEPLGKVHYMKVLEWLPNVDIQGTVE